MTIYIELKLKLTHNLICQNHLFQERKKATVKPFELVLIPKTKQIILELPYLMNTLSYESFDSMLNYSIHST